MSKGKDICQKLREVRRKIAEANQINLKQEECTHKGDCMGTCPKCEQEVSYLQRELSKRKFLGKAASVIGVAAGIAGQIALTSCAKTEDEPLMGVPAMPQEEYALMGDVIADDFDQTDNTDDCPTTQPIEQNPED